MRWFQFNIRCIKVKLTILTQFGHLQKKESLFLYKEHWNTKMSHLQRGQAKLQKHEEKLTLLLTEHGSLEMDLRADVVQDKENTDN